MSKEAEAALMQMLESIFADEIVDVEERTRLLDLEEHSGLSRDEMHRVFQRFVEAKWGEAMIDDRFTDHEALVLERILEELELPPERIPLQLRLALKNH
ncbi:MAG: hypothetical protein U0230_12535 [Polyangiales bacterium]